MIVLSLSRKGASRGGRGPDVPAEGDQVFPQGAKRTPQGAEGDRFICHFREGLRVFPLFPKGWKWVRYFIRG